MLFDVSNLEKTLQDAVDQWLPRISMVKFSCECKEQFIKNRFYKPYMFYTNHWEDIYSGYARYLAY